MRAAKILTSVCVLFVMTALAFAQPGPGGPGGPGGQRGGRGFGGPGGPGGPGGGGFGMLTNNPDLKAAIGLSDEQVQKIEDMQRQFRENMPRPTGDFRNMSQAERDKMMTEMRKRMEDHQTQLKAVLTPEQVKKYNVVRFQVSGGLDAPGPGAADALDALDLTADQKAKIEKIRQEQFEKVRGLFGPPGENSGQNREDRRAKMEELQKEMKSKVEGVLTAEQKALAAKLTEEGKELREKVMQSRRDRRGADGERRGDGDYRPGGDSWRPGQGAQDNDERPRDGNRRGFPRSREE